MTPTAVCVAHVVFGYAYADLIDTTEKNGAERVVGAEGVERSCRMLVCTYLTFKKPDLQKRNSKLTFYAITDDIN